MKSEIIGAVTLAVCTVLGGVWIAVGDDYNKATQPEKTETETPIIAYTVDMGYLIPSGNTSFKSYMDYRSITDIHSAQYKLQDDCWTDENGLRRCGDDYVIAVGSYYADCIGDRLEITLDSGVTFTAVVGDFKADAHTDKTHRYVLMENGNKNVVEFVVDVDALPHEARRMGDISYISGFNGDIDSITAAGDIS